jgi:hypothetical protein
VLSGTTGQLSAVHLIDDWWSKFENAWFGRALAGDQFVTWFQPIMEIAEVSEASNATSERIFAHECLIRLCDGRVYNGSEIVEAACARNEMRAFDSYARRLAIRSAAGQSPAGLYFINFMPSSIYNPSLCMRSSIDAVEESDEQQALINLGYSKQEESLNVSAEKINAGVQLGNVRAAYGASGVDVDSGSAQLEQESQAGLLRLGIMNTMLQGQQQQALYSSEAAAYASGASSDTTAGILKAAAAGVSGTGAIVNQLSGPSTYNPGTTAPGGGVPLSSQIGGYQIPF